ncbi:MAG: hypothetical protein LBL15_02390 [Oscillospiraceae bacterium]|nr:hypothetical protein [Oscillospiraceae bacterium]
MKRIIVLSVSFLLIAAVIGLYSNATFKDGGVISISNIEDIRLLNCNITQIFDEDDTFGVFKNAYAEQRLAELNAMDFILVVKPANHIREYNFTLTQRVQIAEVIKGDAAVGEFAELVSSGGVYDQKYRAIEYFNSRPVYSGFINLLLPDNEYLVFVNALETNELTDLKRYRIESPFFCVLNLTSDYSRPVDKPVNALTYNDFDESEFFCQSDKIRDRILEVKRHILQEIKGVKSG